MMERHVLLLHVPYFRVLLLLFMMERRVLLLQVPCALVFLLLSMTELTRSRTTGLDFPSTPSPPGTGGANRSPTAGPGALAKQNNAPRRIRSMRRNAVGGRRFVAERQRCMKNGHV